jgi:hypothetical protein
MSRAKAKRPAALVLADIPERNRLRELQQLLNNRRDQIAELDLEIETLRDTLAAFEATYHARLRLEHEQLRRIESLVRHMERWAELLREQSARRVQSQARRLEARRARELKARIERAKREVETIEAVVEAATRSPDERLKTAYRALARRFHPDLARTEEERLRAGDLMARINALYHAGDLARLEAMAEQAKGGDVDEDAANVLEQIAQLEERLRWFDMVLQNLRDERSAIERSPTCELMRDVQQAEAAARDLVAEIKKELAERVERAYEQVSAGAHALEAEVREFNRRQADASLTPRGKQTQALERRFDPYADKRLVRLGLEELRDLHVSPEARRQAEVLEEQTASSVALQRLVLLTYVTELSPFPLPGLESYDDVVARFDFLGASDEHPLPLDKALVEADYMLEFGVRRASEKVAHTGLRFRSDVVREAVPLLLKSVAQRREFKRILGVLGEREECSQCGQAVYTVPLFRTRGLDDLRASVCPECGHTLRSYWMPKGKDVQAVLNAAFLDFDIVTEWSFQLARGSVGIQLLPIQVEAMRVGDLRRRLFDDIFQRYELKLELAQMQLLQRGKVVGDKRQLAEVLETSFAVRFTSDAAMSENEALELLRYRVRRRFQAG